MSGPRETLFAAIAAQVQEIRIANGYDVDVDAVYRRDVAPDEMPNGVRRAVLVLESLTPETWSFLDNGAQGGYQSRVNITIAGVVREGSGMVDAKSPDLHTAINALFNDTVAALMEDPTFSDAANESMLQNPVVFVDTDRNEGLFNISLRCAYTFGYGDL